MAEIPKHVRTSLFHADAFRMSFAMAKVIRKRIDETLSSVEPIFANTGTFDESIASAFTDAWGLVDILHRVRDLAQQTSLFPARRPASQIFLRKTEAAEDLRHYFQHFRSGISSIPLDAHPLFGTLSWVSKSNSQRQYSIISGSLRLGVGTYGCTYDRLERKFCQRVLLLAGDSQIDLDSGFLALESYIDDMIEYLREKEAGELAEGPLGLALTVEAQTKGPNQSPETRTTSGPVSA